MITRKEKEIRISITKKRDNTSKNRISAKERQYKNKSNAKRRQK
jgi:hypothetical protein